MNFAVQPPEITSGQMYTGPGAGPMLAAAAAWEALAAELQSTASSYGAIVEGLANEAWAGPSAVAMAAAATDVAAPPSGIFSDLLEAIGNASRGYMEFWDQVLNTLTGSPLAGTTWQNTFGILADIGRFSTVANDSMSPINLAMTEFKMFYNLPVEGLDIPKSALGAGLGMRSAGAGLTSAVSAGMGEANVVGKLSVPPAWASATPAIRLASGLAPSAGIAAAPAAGIPGSLLGQMALGSLTGGALGAVTPQVVSGGGVRARAGGATKAAEPVKLDDVIAKLQKQPEAVQHWNVDKAGLDDLLDQLSKKPGIHAVHVSSGDKPKVTLPDARLGKAGSA